LVVFHPHRSPDLRYARAPIFDTLERRALMAATISGTVMQDMTGNGLTADDKGLSGVVVRLYKDKNANGKLDASDGAAIASKSTNASGGFSFTGLSTGKYILQDVPSANQVRTAPALLSTIAVNATKANGTYSGKPSPTTSRASTRPPAHFADRHLDHAARHELAGLCDEDRPRPGFQPRFSCPR
jgi:hypothetical protein